MLFWSAAGYPDRYTLMLKTLFTAGLFCCLASSIAGCSGTIAPPYGRWEKYSSVQPIKYPDFDLYYVGQKPNGFYPGQTERRLADIFVFEARRSSDSAEILWSEGTGDIGPELFSIGGKPYMLEMLHSDIIKGGFVDSSYVAVCPRTEWERLKRKPWWVFW